jgi:hypothetical protein
MKFPSFQKIALLTVGVLAGNWIVDQWVIKQTNAAGQETGWVVVEPGFGQDDIIRAAVVSTVAIVTGQLVR